MKEELTKVSQRANKVGSLYGKAPETLKVVKTSSPDPYITRLISAIADRMMEIDPDTDRLSLEMDIGACHMNGCPLDLHRLLAAPHGDFGHDVRGITRFLDRHTGKIPENQFWPRCALPEKGLL